MTPKVALITASSAGLGAATAKGLASAGYKIVINYHSSKEKADALEQEILNTKSSFSNSNEDETHQPRCISIKADMSQRTEIKQLIDTTISKMGRLDVVVSNQGWTRIRRFEDLDDNMEESDWDMCFNMNVKSHLYLFHAASPYLEESQGSFVTIASLAGVVPSGSSIAYSVTKAAQIHLAKTLAKISGPNVRVNSISPGILLTEWGKRFPEEKLDAAKSKSVLKRLAQIEDVVQQIVVFAQSQSMTGCNAVVDAGWSLS